jgi:hypothetical protein
VNKLRITVAWSLLSPLAALAQTSARPDPADPGLRAPAPAMESAFAGYRSYRDEPLADWRAVNDEVRAVGGHAGHIRDNPAPAEHGAAPTGDSPAPKPAAPTAGGHKHAQ